MMTMQWTPAKKITAAVAVAGLGLLVFHSRRRYAEHNGSPIALDADLTSDTRKAVLAALAHETDVSILHTFATKLGAANHVRSAELIAAKADSLLHVVGASVDSHTVMMAQAALRAIGFDVEVDGSMGPKTVLAIKRFQSLHDLDIDGILGSATMVALMAAAKGGS